VPWISRPLELYRLWKGRPGVELLRYMPREFERQRRRISIVAEAVKEGIEI
jgi:hypothetical protein